MTELHVVFKVADGEYALAASSVLQMESYTGATLVPGAQSFVAGLIHVRGRIVPVVDLRARFGFPPAEHGLDARVVVVELRDRTVGLLVDSAREVIQLAPEQMEPPPRVVAGETQSFIRAIAHVGTRLLFLIDFAKVIGEESLDVN